MKRLVEDLKPHPTNSAIYEAFDESSKAFQQLFESVRDNGLLQPIVARGDGTVLSGHRRLAVVKKLGWTDVEVVEAPEGDDRQLIIEYNRYRHKTVGELMREAEMLERIWRERGEAHIRGGRGATVAPEEKVDTKVHVAAAINMKPRTYAKLRAVWEAAKENENVKANIEKIDRGEMSIDAAYKQARAIVAPTAGDGEVPDFIRYFNSWQFAENDPRFGIPHPGRIPGQIAGNVIWYYTEPGDLVVDPMAGGGSTLDVAKFLGRDCQAYDVHPRRPDIIEWDVSKGFHPDAKDCDLIFMDPPYWNMKDEGYVDESSSRLSLDEFTAWYVDLMASAASTVKLGGFVAVINMGQYFRLPDDFVGGYVDWPVVTYKALELAGLVPWARVAVIYPTSLYGGFDIEVAKEYKYFLPNLGDIVVARRMI